MSHQEKLVCPKSEHLSAIGRFSSTGSRGSLQVGGVLRGRALVAPVAPVPLSLQSAPLDPALCIGVESTLSLCCPAPPLVGTPESGGVPRGAARTELLCPPGLAVPRIRPSVPLTSSRAGAQRHLGLGAGCSRGPWPPALLP